MADTTANKKKEVKPGKTFNFSLTGDDFYLYETIRDIYQDAEEEGDATVADALAELDPAVRALIESRIAPKPARREISPRQVFVRALQAAMDAEDAATDEHETAPEDDDAGSETADTEG